MAFNDLSKFHWDEENSLWITSRGRITFVALARRFKSKKSKRLDDKGAFTLTLITQPEIDLTAFKKAINVVAQEGKGSTKLDLFAPGKNVAGVKCPIMRADEKVADITSKGVPVDLEGWQMLRANTYKSRPVVRMPNGELIDEDDLEVEAYSGRWARMMVRPAYYDNEGQGVKLWLEGVQLLRNDDPIGGFAHTDGSSFGAVDDEEDDSDSPL